MMSPPDIEPARSHSELPSVGSTTVPADTGSSESGALAWDAVVGALRHEMAARGWHPARTVVLLPYTQLQDVGRRAWARHSPSGFPPRFETTLSWASSLRPFVPGPTDWSGDTARDALSVDAMLRQVHRQGAGGGLRSTLVARVLEAARQLAPLASAQTPEERQQWANAMQENLSGGMQHLFWETMAASIALSWLGLSGFATDALWNVAFGGTEGLDGVLALPGLQEDPLVLALVSRAGAKGGWLPALEPAGGVGPDGAVDADLSRRLRLLACDDGADEAQVAAACVLDHLEQGRIPVALVAQDRVATRRVGAMLEGMGVAIRDETGWRLSTTQAAASLMAWLRAAHPRARTDDVLDLLKLVSNDAPMLEGVDVDALEAMARQHQLSQWSALERKARDEQLWPQGLNTAFSCGESVVRSLSQWLAWLGDGVKAAGWWSRWGNDAAGVRVMTSLRLEPDALMDLQHSLLPEAMPGRMSLSSFTAWVRQVLENATFMPGRDHAAHVIVLPMTQLMGRHFAACVMPGCDDARLSASPEPVGPWTRAQREVLGLPSREKLSEQARLAWRHVVAQPRLDLLWRTSEGQERLTPGVWVRQVLDTIVSAPFNAEQIANIRWSRPVEASAKGRPAPTADDLPIARLSATHYQDLRDCPYRYFALRLLGLKDRDELDQEIDKRDWGIWLHAILKRFHEERRDGVSPEETDRRRLDRLAEEETTRMGLQAGGDSGAFLPLISAWPRLRDGYLQWLSRPLEAGGGDGLEFQLAEVSQRGQLGGYAIYGVLDRLDLAPSVDGDQRFIIDYKTTRADDLKRRVADCMEDTQTAFYAALLTAGSASPVIPVRAAYLAVSDQLGDTPQKSGTVLVEQADVMAARDALMSGVVSDLSRIEAGHPLYPMGEGRLCDRCEARGLCRKDFWEAAQ